MKNLKTDYLIVGAGAMGMAFSDTILKESGASILIIDKQDRPGGHWNNSYPFVRLHQPSSFYGVNSRKLGNDTIDAVGWNEGLFELASGSEVVTYFDQVMQQQFLPTGRVQYFPMCEYLQDNQFKSLITGQTFSVSVGKKTVDATYMNVTVPSMRKPDYEVAASVRCVPLNELPKQHLTDDLFEEYTVIGAGKTGMDACLWLLKNKVSPQAIRWIMPRDSWMFDRKNIQPGAEFFDDAVTNIADQAEAIGKASSLDDMFERLHECGHLLRFTDDVKPTMWRCATVTKLELEQLRKISNIVRMGRVRSINDTKIHLDDGDIKITQRNLFVDCSADGLERRPAVPVFNGDQLTLQTVRTCQQVFSAAFISHVELAYTDENEKNDLCQVVPHPDSDTDFVRASLQNNLNAQRWSQDNALQSWLMTSRLDGFSRTPEELSGLTDAQQKVIVKLLTNTPLATTRLQELLTEIESG